MFCRKFKKLKKTATVILDAELCFRERERGREKER